MAFRMSSECEKWFRNIKKEGATKTQFDIYYLCLMAGFSSGRVASVTGAEFVKYFVDDYRQAQLSLLGILIFAEAKRFGLSVEDRDATRKFINEYISADDPSRLSSSGFARLNEYAAGGFAYLRENFQEEPQQFLPFMERYTALMRGGFPKLYPQPA